MKQLNFEELAVAKSFDQGVEKEDKTVSRQRKVNVTRRELAALLSYNFDHRRRSSSAYGIYEEKKKWLQKENLPSSLYEQRIVEIAEELGL